MGAIKIRSTLRSFSSEVGFGLYQESLSRAFVFRLRYNKQNQARSAGSCHKISDGQHVLVTSLAKAYDKIERLNAHPPALHVLT